MRKHVTINTSLTEVLSPVYDYLQTFVPHAITPNMLTLTGGASCVRRLVLDISPLAHTFPVP